MGEEALTFKDFSARRTTYAHGYPGGNRNDRRSAGVAPALPQWLGSDPGKIATFHAEEVVQSTEDSSRVVTQKDRA
jgi:hypothetical protein